MEAPGSFRDIIRFWPNRPALQNDLKKLGGAVKTAAVREWEVNDSIPPSWFDALIQAAAARGFPGVTYPLLSELARKRWDGAPH